jgi:hypothetical protein
MTTAKTLLDLIIANLDSATNGVGRPITEYRVRIELLQDGVMALHVAAEDHGEVTVYGIDGNQLTDAAGLQAAVIAARKVALDAEKAIWEKSDADRKARDAASEAALVAEREAKALEAAKLSKLAATVNPDQPANEPKPAAPVTTGTT